MLKQLYQFVLEDPSRAHNQLGVPFGIIKIFGQNSNQYLSVFGRNSDQFFQFFGRKSNLLMKKNISSLYLNGEQFMPIGSKMGRLL